LIGEILARFEKRGLQIVGMKLMRITPAIAEVHYEAHKAKPFYPGLVRFMTNSPVVVFAVQGKDAITIARKMMGATKAGQAEPGTIRGDFGLSNSFNLIHGSDSPEAATRELGIFFKPEELLDWKPDSQVWSYDMAKGTPE
jgi:nucleoside-diphosphate kinase